MIEIIIEVLVFVLLVAAFVVALDGAAVPPQIILLTLMSGWNRLFSRKLPPLSLYAKTLFINIVNVVLSPTIAYLLWFRPETVKWLRFWEYPLAVTLPLLGLVYMASNLAAYNPLLRRQASGAVVSAWVLSAMVLLGALAPQYVWHSTFRYAVTVALAVTFLLAWYALLVMSKNIRNFQNLDQRHDAVGESLTKMRNVAGLLSGSESLKPTLEAVETIHQGYAEILQALREERSEEANRLLIQTEVELKQVEKTFSEQVPSFLPDVLRTRLLEASAEIKNLQKECQDEGINAINLSEMLSRVEELMAEAGKLTASDDTFFERLEPFQQLFKEIEDTRAALRFRQNVDTFIASLNTEVRDKTRVIRIAQTLGLPVATGREGQGRLEQALKTFLSDPVKKSGELVQTYLAVQDALLSFRTAVDELTSAINGGWNRQSLDSGQVSLYVPKACDTDAELRGAINALPGEPAREKLSVELDSAMLDLPKDRTVEIHFAPGDGYAISPFTFAGKRGGQAKLTAKVKEVPGSSHTFDVLVRPSFIEIARDSLIFGAPIGGVAALVFYYAGFEPKEAIPIGGASGAALSLVVFLFLFMQYRRG